MLFRRRNRTPGGADARQAPQAGSDLLAGKGAKKRAWGNFADYADVGGTREALIPPGSKLATTDPVLAETLAADRLKELEAARRGKVLTGVAQQATLSQFAEQHLIAKAKAAKVTFDWVAKSERYLQSAVDFFGADRALGSIGVRDVEAWMHSLAEKSGRRGRNGLSGKRPAGSRSTRRR